MVEELAIGVGGVLVLVLLVVDGHWDLLSPADTGVARSSMPVMCSHCTIMHSDRCIEPLDEQGPHCAQHHPRSSLRLLRAGEHLPLPFPREASPSLPRGFGPERILSVELAAAPAPTLPGSLAGQVERNGYALMGGVAGVPWPKRRDAAGHVGAPSLHPVGEQATVSAAIGLRAVPAEGCEGMEDLAGRAALGFRDHLTISNCGDRLSLSLRGSPRASPHQWDHGTPLS